MGQGAEDADGFFEAMQDREELQRMMFTRVVVDNNVSPQFNRINYPNEPMYALHQAKLMEKLSENERKALCIQRYNAAKKAKVGDSITCAGCGCKMVKKSYQQAFCKDKIKGRSNCKDFVNNWINVARYSRMLDLGIVKESPKQVDNTSEIAKIREEIKKLEQRLKVLENG